MQWSGLYIIVVVVLYFLSIFNLLSDYGIYIPLLLTFIPVLFHAIGELKNKKIGSEIFLVVATIVGLIGNEAHAVTAILIIMLIAEYLQERIQERTELALHSLVKLIPTDVIARIDNQEKNIPIEKVVPGMQLIIKTGKRIPVDGIVHEGTAIINEATLTGESTLKEKTIGAQVFAGTFVQAGSIIVQVEKVAGQTFFGKILSMVESAQESKSKIATYADKVANILVPSMLIFIGIVWLITKNTSLVVTLLVFGSPLELTLITPLAVLAGIAAAFRHGILVKGGLGLERLSGVDTIVFDKTGTLTIGDPEVMTIEVCNPSFNAKQVLTIAAIAQKRSDHVFSKAILKKARKEGIDIPDPEAYASESGHGVEVIIAGKKYFLGNRHYIEAPEHGNIQFKDQSQEHGFFSSFYLASNQDGLIAKILLADTLRADAKETLAILKKSGIKQMILLSGDRQEVVDSIAKDLGIEKAYGGLFPDQKIEMIKKLQEQGARVAMVGDGINDAPALRQARVGIAMGAMGMEPAIEAADIVLMTNDLSKIVFVYDLARATLKVIKQNIILGFVVIHILGICLAFLRLITPIQAALFHAVPDLMILVNSARLIGYRVKSN